MASEGRWRWSWVLKVVQLCVQRGQGRSGLEGTERAEVLWLEHDLPTWEMDRSVGQPGPLPS